MLKYVRYIFVIGALFVLVGVKVNAATITIGLANPVERLIPISIKSPTTFPVSMQIYEGLFDTNAAGKVIPKLIEKWKTKDFQKWIFYVRKGVYFQHSKIFKHKTREITANDIIYSLTRFCSPSSYPAFLLIDSIKGAKAYNEGKAKSVSGIKKLGKFKLEIDLIRPERFFINTLSTAWISVFPKEMDEKKYTNQDGISIAVGTGPYILQSKTPSEIVLARNKDYWNKKDMPHIDKIAFKIIRDDQSRFISLVRGNIDMMKVPVSIYPSIMDKKGRIKKNILKKFNAKIISTYNTHFIGINTQTVSDVNLRKAMFYGTDRKAIVNSILYGYGDVTGGTIPPGMNGYVPPFHGQIYNPKKAKEYLKKSHYDGKPLDLLVYNLNNAQQIGEIFQAQMAKLGIKILLKKKDFNSVINDMVKGNDQLFSMFFEYVFSSPEPILINLFSTSKIPVPNFFHFSDERVDRMLKRLYTIKNKRHAVNLCSDIEAMIMNKVPAIFLYRGKYIYLYPKNMQDLEISGNNHWFLEKLNQKK